MKKIVTLLIAFLPVLMMSQDYKEESVAYQEQLNDDYKNGENSPLNLEDKERFTALNFFDFNPDYIVKARFEKSEEQEEIIMATSTSRKASYVRYGTLYFTIDGVDCQLTIFQNLSLKEDPEYYNYLFVPFKDATNGDTTYGAGRYMELRSPLENEVVLNFNNTYNPYCAYSYKYSCPIPPDENHLKVEINAGVMVGFE